MSEHTSYRSPTGRRARSSKSRTSHPQGSSPPIPADSGLKLSTSTRNSLLSFRNTLDEIDKRGEAITQWPSLRGFLQSSLPVHFVELLEITKRSPNQIEKHLGKPLSFLSGGITLKSQELDIRRFGLLFIKQLGNASVNSLLKGDVQSSIDGIPIQLSRGSSSDTTSWIAIQAKVMSHFDLDTKGDFSKIRLPTIPPTEASVEQRLIFQIVVGLHLFFMSHLRHFLSTPVQELVITARKEALSSSQTVFSPSTPPARVERKEFRTFERIRNTLRLTFDDDDDKSSKSGGEEDLDTVSEDEPIAVTSDQVSSDDSEQSVNKLVGTRLWNELRLFNLRTLFETLLKVSLQDSSTKPLLSFLGLVRNQTNGRNLSSWLVTVSDATSDLYKSFTKTSNDAQQLSLMQIRSLFRGPIMETFASQLTNKEISYVHRWTGENLSSCNLTLEDLSKLLSSHSSQFEEQSLRDLSPQHWNVFKVARAKTLSQGLDLVSLTASINSSSSSSSSVPTFNALPKREQVLGD